MDGAIAHLNRALGLGPETAEVHNNLGVAMAAKGQLDEAIPHFERALQISPNMVEAHAHLGVALVINGQRAQGLAHWRLALKKDPDNLRVLNDTAWLLSTSSDPALRNGKEAISLAEHAVHLTSAQEPALLATLAAAYAEVGEFTEAIELEQRATELANQQGKTGLAATLSGRIELFQAKTPFRQR
jgi:tetratricopeptide (TPR) repeat protein